MITFQCGQFQFIRLCEAAFLQVILSLLSVMGKWGKSSIILGVMGKWGKSRDLFVGLGKKMLDFAIEV